MRKDAPAARRSFPTSATFVVAREGERWTFGAPQQSFVVFDSKTRAIEHARKVVSRIPRAVFAVMDR